MAKGVNQKQKLLYLAKIFSEETDEKHGLSVNELSNRLAEWDISAERKTLYSDFEELRHFGMDIISETQDKKTVYKLASRKFELSEIKILVDLVQSAKFITEKKSNELIKKLESLSSIYDAKQLHRQVILSGRIKNANENIYINVDRIHSAIAQDVQIKFQYFQWNLKKEMELRHDGAWYVISPWALVWDDENYYMIGFDAEAGKMKHYRVDKMLHISSLMSRREGSGMFDKMSLPKYSEGLFGMYGGEMLTVMLECENDVVGIFIDRFGKNIPITPIDDNHFRTRITVQVSSHFFGWVIALEEKVKIVSPESVVERIKKEAKRLSVQYLEN